MLKKRWLIPSALYVIFFLWYTNISGPMSEAEINTVIGRIDSGKTSISAEDREDFLKFLRQDDGGDFYMVNFLDINESPPTMEMTGENASAFDLLDHYMEYMYPELFKRASHPVYVGNAISNSVDIVGIANAEVWERAVLMRYKSRRAFMEIIANPEILGEHKYKIAAVNKTIAFPAESAIFFGDVRLIFGLILLIIGLLVRSRARK